MARRASQATDLRAFVEYAKRRPGEGGIAYAFAALMQCAQRSSLHRETTQMAAKMARDASLGPRLQAMDTLARRCAGFTDEELSSAALLKLRESGKGIDPVVTTLAEFDAVRRSGDLQARRALAAQVLATQDPQLVLQLLPSLVGQVGANGDRTVFVDGQANGGLSEGDFQHALLLVECSLGVDCGAAHAEVLTTCLTDAVCAEDRRDLYRQLLGEARFERIARLSERLATIVVDADLQALSPPAAPAPTSHATTRSPRP